MNFYDFNESTCPQDVPCQAGFFQNKQTVENRLFFRQESNLAWTMRLWMPNWVCWWTKHLLLDHKVECFLHIGARPVGSARCYSNHGDWGTFSVPNEATLLCILRMERNLSPFLYIKSLSERLPITHTFYPAHTLQSNEHHQLFSLLERITNVDKVITGVSYCTWLCPPPVDASMQKSLWRSEGNLNSWPRQPWHPFTYTVYTFTMKLVKRIVQQMFLFNLFMQKNEKKRSNDS